MGAEEASAADDARCQDWFSYTIRTGSFAFAMILPFCVPRSLIVSRDFRKNRKDFEYIERL